MKCKAKIWFITAISLALPIAFTGCNGGFVEANTSEPASQSFKEIVETSPEVSVPTISHDRDNLDVWLGEYEYKQGDGSGDFNDSFLLTIYKEDDSYRAKLKTNVDYLGASDYSAYVEGNSYRIKIILDATVFNEIVSPDGRYLGGYVAYTVGSTLFELHRDNADLYEYAISANDTAIYTIWREIKPWACIGFQKIESKEDTPHNLDAWVGEYRFGEFNGRTMSGTAISYEYTLSIYKEADDYRAKLAIDGWQMGFRAYATAPGGSENGVSWLFIDFERYGEEGIPSGYVDLQKNDLLFELCRFDNGELYTAWYGIRPQSTEAFVKVN